MSRESFIFYRSFFQTIDALPVEMQRNLYRAIALYGLDKEEVELGTVEQAIWFSFKAQLEANWRRHYNGLNGGAPKGSKNNPNGRRGKSTKNKPRTNQELTDNKPNVNDNDNVNVNENDNDNENIVVVEGASAIDKFRTEVYSSQIMMENACKSLRISQPEYLRLAEEVLADWEMVQEKDVSRKHLLNTLRIKADAWRKQQPKQSSADNRASRDQYMMDVLQEFAERNKSQHYETAQ